MVLAAGTPVSPSFSSRNLIVRPPQTLLLRSRNPSTLASIVGAVRRGLVFGRREWSFKPLVSGLATNPETTAQLPNVGTLLHRKRDELTPLIHNRHLAKWHPQTLPIRQSGKCQPCLRTVSAMSPVYTPCYDRG